MSRGKYAFVDPGDADEQWRVLDAVSGQDRSPASLSGGEQFIAWLSRALGMVEMLARSGGRLESLFLDEGFGSLDRNNLDAAVQALGTVAAGGRHGRRDLPRTRGRGADRARSRGDAERNRQLGGVATSRARQRLSEWDTGMEAAAALAGLLE